jgi:hypothetical protein
LCQASILKLPKVRNYKLNNGDSKRLNQYIR